MKVPFKRKLGAAGLTAVSIAARPVIKASHYVADEYYSVLGHAVYVTVHDCEICVARHTHGSADMYCTDHAELVMRVQQAQESVYKRKES